MQITYIFVYNNVKMGLPKPLWNTHQSVPNGFQVVPEKN